MTVTLHRHNHGRRTWNLTDTGDNWRERAACADMDPELFTHLRCARPVTTPTPTETYAIHTCQHCPVARQCYDAAAAADTAGVIQAGLFWPLRLNPTTPIILTSRQPPRRPLPDARVCDGCSLPLPPEAITSRRYCTDNCRRRHYRRTHHKT